MRMRSVRATMLALFAGILIEPPSSAAEPPAKSASDWVGELVKDGRLTVDFYDPAKPPHPFPGWTDFEFRLEYRYDYRTEWTQKKGAPVIVVVTPKFTKLEVPIKHHVQLPMYLKTERWYDAGLARHELDHVRVGMHPRLAMLGKHLMAKVQRIDGRVENVTDATADWIAKRVDAEMEPRRDALQALVLAINRKIDAITNHGATPLPDRDEFLSNLYLKENLDEMKFPYLSQVLDLIDRPEYQQAHIQLQQIEAPASPPKK